MSKLSTIVHPKILDKNSYHNYTFNREWTSPNEAYLFDYGTFLMTHNSLWQAGVTYLDYCSTLGKGCLSLFLSKLDIKSDLRVSKILHYAKARRLHNVGK